MERWANFYRHRPSQIIDEILQQNNYKLQTTNYKLTLIGFSLGGRMALSFLQANPEKVEKLILLAPDGLKVNFWYWLATQTCLGNKFFAFTLKTSRLVLWLSKIDEQTKLVNASIFKFVNYYIGDAQFADYYTSDGQLYEN